MIANLDDGSTTLALNNLEKSFLLALKKTNHSPTTTIRIVIEHIEKAHYYASLLCEKDALSVLFPPQAFTQLSKHLLEAVILKEAEIEQVLQNLNNQLLELQNNLTLITNRTLNAHKKKILNYILLIKKTVKNISHKKQLNQIKSLPETSLLMLCQDICS